MNAVTSTISRAKAMATLARWLGPWADQKRGPARITTTEDVIDGSTGPLHVRIFHPDRAPRSTVLVAPGLHYAGPDDPRMDRFCRVLAAAEHLVIAPFIPDFLALTPTARAIQDFTCAFEQLDRWSSQPPIVFSISFGSLLAFALAAEHGDALARLVIFGGYSDIAGTLRFALTGEVGDVTRTRDPLNQPVVLANLLDHIDPVLAPADRSALLAGWRRYVERTWGRPELKARARFVAIADELAPGVPDAVRELFLIGIGARPGAAALATSALAGFDARALDPSPYLARIRGRVDLVHGADDDVIPFEHSHALAARLVSADAQVHVTGLYGHTGSALPRPSNAMRELATMIRILRVLA